MQGGDGGGGALAGSTVSLGGESLVGPVLEGATQLATYRFAVAAFLGGQYSRGGYVRLRGEEGG